MEQQSRQESDRRKFKRYAIKGRAYTVNTPKSGLIVDISRRGLAFQYFDRKSIRSSPAHLDILLEETDVYLAGIPIEIMSDVKINHSHPDRSVVVKRMGVRFGDLSVDQKIGLEELIQKFTRAE